ncbi:hypothetical protein GCM10010156_65080 [Planobispora rosea]|uniref:Uncharacterized protein n=1 Tax=Planobispora rosea TaxID=35762 RepID=A0A8J3WFX5_PLARO|nr:hypothetical protein [Planobispora rosea]GGS97854.1 hypothetical protein GCM10010156_65080 [Planobispora rosea]GIH87813.1 hypothetical protein Pro02_62210 [Planobispora rosea]
MRNWFGPRGPQLLQGAEEGSALDAFELAILLINRGSTHEGAQFLRYAGSWENRLTLDFEDFRDGDQLYGMIVKDVCRRVGAAYDHAGYSIKADMWSRYAETVTSAAPIALLTRASGGRHARNRSRYCPFDPNQVQEIESFYWHAYATDPDNTSFTERDRRMLSAILADRPVSDAYLFDQHSRGKRRKHSIITAASITSVAPAGQKPSSSVHGWLSFGCRSRIDTSRLRGKSGDHGSSCYGRVLQHRNELRRNRRNGFNRMDNMPACRGTCLDVGIKTFLQGGVRGG